MFEIEFQKLTGFAPMAWQRRLYDVICQHGLPEFMDVPTGLGKTSVMAIWLLARASAHPVPRRLVYVVDRRAVVDQATTFAEKLRDSLRELPELMERLGVVNHLPISTLRGKFADNRQWLEDPSHPAIVVGTVDMIGSRLLFEGYGISPKMRPYHAGLLGADSLVVLDESHLVPPFAELLRTIQCGGELWGAQGERRLLVPAFHLMSLSATGSDQGKGFRFETDDLSGDEVASERWNAAKSLTVVSGQGKLVAELAELAWDLSGRGQDPIRCVIFCNERDVAEKVFDELRKRSKDAELELLVGARRVREREAVNSRLHELGFLDSRSEPKLTFLLATSAGEVGVDLDAQHMVCDLVPWERMVQRLGRVNRKGKGRARVQVVQSPPDPKDSEKNARLKTVVELLGFLPETADGLDVSPRALSQLKQRSELRDKIVEGSTPAPLRPALELAHLEAWAMTSLPEPDPGRPAIQPWLRGWVEEKPQTVLAWRVWLPARWDRVPEERYSRDLNRFFEAAPIHLSEQLETETHRVVEWLRGRAFKARASFGEHEVVGFVLDARGELKIHESRKEGKVYRCLRLGDLLNPDKESFKLYQDSLRQWLAGATVVLSAKFGGLSGPGLLSVEAGEVESTLDNTVPWQEQVGFRVRFSEENGDLPAGETDWSSCYRFPLKKENEKSGPFLLVEKLRVASSNEDDRATSRGYQLLSDHQNLAEELAAAMGDRLQLPEPYRRMLCLAARYHDEGKAAPGWQRAFRAFQAPVAGVYAKTRGPIDFEVLAGYRHEFGSLPVAELHLQQLPEELRELCLHLIAAHHGQGRPYMRTQGCQDAPPGLLSARACQVALRYAEMQVLWGPWGLAWWESLLRAADHQASRLVPAQPREAACATH
jgi:CRISPR-associated endonuclease/helicase Cas3